MDWKNPLYIKLKTLTAGYTIAQIQNSTPLQMANILNIPCLATNHIDFAVKVREHLVAYRKRELIKENVDQMKTFLINGRGAIITSAYPDIQWEFKMFKDKPLLSIYPKGKPELAEFHI